MARIDFSSRSVRNPPDEESDVHPYVLLDQKIRRVTVEKKQYANKLTGAVFPRPQRLRLLITSLLINLISHSIIMLIIGNCCDTSTVIGM